MKKAFVYLRVSTSKQAGKDVDPEGYSIPAQRGECYRKAAELGAQVLEEFIDLGESAKTADRPQLQAMLAQLAESRSIDYVIVHKVDRLARNREDDVAVNLAIRKAGAQLVSVTENIDDTPTGKLVHGLMATVAEFYSANNGHEALKGMTQKAKVGGTPGQAPLGYRNIRQVLDNRVIRTVEIDPERAPLIQWAFETYATGDVTVKELTDQLAERGLRSRPVGKKPSKPLHYSRVAAMLNNRYYIGKVTFRGIEYEGRHEPLVSDKLFLDVQEILATRRHASERQRKHNHYLKGSVFCGRCKSRLLITLANGHGGSYLYFFCQARQKGSGCRQRFLQVPDVEDAVERFYKTVQLEPSRLEKLRDRLRTHLSQLRVQREREAKRQERRVARLAGEQDRLMEALYAGLPMERFRQEQARIAKETAEARVLLEGCQVRSEKVEETIEQALDICVNLHDLYKRSGDQVRRLMNQSIFENLWIGTTLLGKPRVSGATLNKPFAALMAHDLAERASREAPPLDLVFSGMGSSNDFLVRPEGLEPPTS